MEVNNWFDLTIFSLFTLAVILIGLPVSMYLLKKGAEGFVKYQFSKLPPDFLIEAGLGRYSVEIIFYAVFMLSFSIWYLFIYKGGQLLNLINQVKFFLE